MPASSSPSAASRLSQLADVLTPYAVRTAATLRLADHVAAGTRTLPDLAATLSGAPRVLSALVHHLVDRGVLTLDGDVVGLTEVGELLRSDVPGSWRAHLDLTGAPGLVQSSWSRLPETVHTGGPAFDGAGFWSLVGEDPTLAQTFATWLGDWADDWVPTVAARLDLGPGCHVLDVGGGDGRLLAALLAGRPDATGTVVELPAAAHLAQERLASARLLGRGDVHAGSFFDPLPPATDVVLAQVLHDWPDDDARRILRRAAEAAVAGEPRGRVVLVERLADEGAAPAMDLLMASLFGSHERTAAEFDDLAHHAGLVPTDRADTGVGLHLFTYLPAPRLPEELP